MDILVTYDVNTQSKAGRRRLAKVAQTCKSFGQRVQFSVFECRVDDVHYEELLSKLTKIINASSDSLRVYRLRGERDDYLVRLGLDRYIDFDEPLVV